MHPEEFEYEYDLGKLQIVRPKKRDSQMLVTPRFVSRYGEEGYEDFTSDLLLSYAKDNMLFIDIGAHYGYYTLLVGTRQPDCKVIAFEPVPENFAILERNVALNNLKNVELHNLAVSDSDGLRKFKITGASDSCGFHEHPLTSTHKEIEVQTVCLEKFLKKLPKVPIIIKLDAEGHEPYILRGMQRLLKDTDDVKLIIEFNPKCLRNGGHEPAEFLKEVAALGFDIYAINDKQRLTYKLAQDSFPNWRDYLPSGDEMAYTNLLCIQKPQSLSVLFFSHTAQLAGAERSLLELTGQLIADHGAVCSVVLPAEGPLKARLEAAGAATLVIDYQWWCDASTLPPEEVKRRLANSFKNVLNRLPDLGKINPDVIFTSTLVIPWGAVAASFLGRPHVWSIREFGELDHNLKFYLPFSTVLNVIKAPSNLILTNSHAVKQALFGEAPPENVLTIYPHIDIPADAIQGDEAGYFTRPQATRLIIFGTIHENKGQKDAILAVRELVRRKQDVELVIMGYADQTYLEELKELVSAEGLESYVKFIDFRENPYPAVNQADIVLVCSRHEALGRVTIEAMLLGKPVIGTNTGGTPELVRDGFNGLLYTPDDYIQLAGKIEYLIKHKAKIKEFGENGYRFARKTFSRDKFGGTVYKKMSRLKGHANKLSNEYMRFINRVTISSMGELNTRIGELNARIDDLNLQTTRMAEELSARNTHINDLLQQLQDKSSVIQQLSQESQDKSSVIQQLSQESQDKSSVIHRLGQELQEKEDFIIYMQNGLVMRLMTAFNLAVNRIMPPGTGLNKCYQSFLARLKGNPHKQ